MAGTILVGVDDSDSAHMAALKAGALAKALDSELHVISVYSNVISGMPRTRASFGDEEVNAVMRAREGKLAQAREYAAETARGVADELRRKYPSLTVHDRGVEGAAGPAIIEESLRLDVDMVVVGNKRVQGMSRILGSVANTVARGVECDLHVVNTSKK